MNDDPRPSRRVKPYPERPRTSRTRIVAAIVRELPDVATTQANAVIDAFIDQIVAEVAAGRHVAIKALGEFRLSRAGEFREDYIAFRCGRAVRDKLNGRAARKGPAPIERAAPRAPKPKNDEAEEARRAEIRARAVRAAEESMRARRAGTP